MPINNITFLKSVLQCFPVNVGVTYTNNRTLLFIYSVPLILLNNSVENCGSLQAEIRL